jgi:hypothetical protein
MSWEDADPIVQRRRRLALATVMFVVVPLAAFVGWNLYKISQRDDLLAEITKHGVGYVTAADRDANGSMDIGVAMVTADARRKTEPDVKIVSDRPAVHRVGAVRSWLGDEEIAMILLWDPEELQTYRTAFPEAWIVADPSLQGARAAPLADHAAAH